MTIETPARTTPAAPPAVSRGIAVPTRREGPAKLTGTALYTDDMVFPGAWYGATIRSTDAHATLLGIELDPGYPWDRVVVVTADDIPGTNVVASIAADLVVFDPATVRSRATYDEPKQFPEGIPYVFVNGVPVVDGGEHTGKTPGRALRRGRAA